MRSARLSTAFIFVALFAAGLSAATLDEYRSHVDAADVGIQSLMDMAGPRDRIRERSSVDTLRRELPVSETVQWSGGSIETSNKWLHEGFDQFLAEPDAVKRAALLAGLSERLKAIVHGIEDLQKAAAGKSTKDEEKRKLVEILDRPEYQRAAPPQESLAQKWLREFQEWLDRVFPSTPNMPAAAPGLGSLKIWLQVLVYALVAGLIGFLLYRFIPYFSQRLGRRDRELKGDRLILGERVASDTSAADLFAHAEGLARDGDLRGAIRKGYVALLCELSDRKVIGLARHKTNRDYLRDMRKRSDILPNVQNLTSNFERSWYGLRDAEQADWEDFRSRYRETLGAVR
jgi:hypothetical protein